MPSGKIFGFLSRFYPRWCVPACGNYSSYHDNPEEGWPHGLEKVERLHGSKQVNIDRSTTVPQELYCNMLKAGEQAKQRGQHELKAKPDRFYANPKQVLVKRASTM
eukprot:gb/GFBE01041583.1/.p1 GENE.gb/GFBE01041583.1/~~gb/GFBE01041583.1/.p1  ORF type:complete len:106 (+),score=22.07 gb/GFBE01041583.1/:1-318(+)